MVEAIIWKGDHLALIDQRYLPFREEYYLCKTVADVTYAIREMVVRGAPAIGVTAAYGLVLALKESTEPKVFEKACRTLFNARPTAVNLRDAIDMMKRGLNFDQQDGLVAQAEKLAVAYHREDTAMNHAMGKHGAGFLEGKRNVLTHCNTGSLATSGWGTALGVIRQLHQEQRLGMVYADETRPFLQGARLTVWECNRDNIPVTLVTDGMGGYLMTHAKVDCVIVGSDRIANNGDVCNKIGTFMLAMAAKHHGIPFVVAAPSTTIDLQCDSGDLIPIEQRPALEVSHVRGQPIVEEGTLCANPAFDVTPQHLVTAIVTEQGVFQAPYDFRNA